MKLCVRRNDNKAEYFMEIKKKEKQDIRCRKCRKLIREGYYCEVDQKLKCVDCTKKDNYCPCTTYIEMQFPNGHNNYFIHWFEVEAKDGEAD